MFEDKTICVFGGTGTVGSLIVEELLKRNVKIIRVFCNSEQELWEKQQEWRSPNIRYLLGDIRNTERVKRALKGVDYVFNCAAVKHVPFAEYNPMEAVDINIHGLENIIEACVYHNIQKLLHISTDKAVKPSTLMGATKMIGERLIQIRWAQNPEVEMVCVRSGNIWNSRGSLVPFIRECKKQEKTITITDPNMTRYFIEPHELIVFIMKAFTEGKEGEVWVPKLKKLNIMDIIHGEVGIEYPTEIIGRRKGEKLHEELISEEELLYSKEKETHWVILNYWSKVDFTPSEIKEISLKNDGEM